MEGGHDGPHQVLQPGPLGKVGVGLTVRSAVCTGRCVLKYGELIITGDHRFLLTDLIGSQEVDSEQRQDQNSEDKEKESKEDAVLY